MTPTWITVLLSLLSGVFGSIIGPFVIHKLYAKRWRDQKGFELRQSSFDKSLQAVSSWQADAFDVNLKNQSTATAQGTRPLTYMRPATTQALHEANGLIKVWFSNDVYNKFDKLLKSTLSINNIPNEQFENARTEYMEAAKKELSV